MPCDVVSCKNELDVLLEWSKLVERVDPDIVLGYNTFGFDESFMYDRVVDLLLNFRIEAKKNKDWATSDKIRNSLTELGFEIKDTKEGFTWELKK